MAVNNNRQNTAYGLSEPLLNVFPRPIIALRDPTTSNFAQLGTIWVNKSSGAFWVLTKIVANSASWDNSSGGAGSFTSLTASGNITSSAGNIAATAGTVTGGTGLVATTGGLTVSAGGASITGVTTIASGTSAINISADAAATTVNIATGAGAKTLTLGSTTTTSTTTLQSGSGGLLLANGANPISISADAAATTVNVGTGAGVKTVTLGSTNTTSVTTINSGTGGIVLSSGGLFSAGVGGDSVASPTTTAVVSKNLGQAVFTGFTTASAASETFTITNTLVTATSAILVSVSTLGSNDAQLTVQRVKPGAGTFDVIVKNNGAAAVNGDIHINFWAID